MDLMRSLASTPGCLGCLVVVALGALSLKPDARGRTDPVGGAIEGALALALGSAAMFSALCCAAVVRDLADALHPMF